MQNSLVIVESPTKAKTISKILGGKYTVTATVGHIIDLPEKKLGVDIENGFKPQYQKLTGKSKVIEQIKKAAEESNRIFIATDPDREGEAIASHIYGLIRTKDKQVGRVLFHEITKSAVLQAMEAPGQIDSCKVDAQQARRVLDRLVGYLVSPMLWKTVSKGLSAGRVQSVALRLICEREEEIKLFKSEEYWTIDADLMTSGKELFRARLASLNEKKLKIKDKKEADKHLNALKSADYILRDRGVKKTIRKPKPPFTTSTLQQEAGKYYRFTGKQTMAVAQSLYEGVELGDKGPVGLITYMRTDSVRCAPEAIQRAREQIAEVYGTEYLPKNPTLYATKGRAQEAHEAIRPTDIKLTPQSLKKFLKPEQLKLYTLIYNRFIASQMADAIFDTTTLTISADNYIFKATGNTPVFLGYLQVWQEKDDSGESSEEKPTKLPVKLAAGEKLKLEGLIPEQHFTEPPPRYTDSSLVKTLDELGIGRPSTYASIISVLFERKYIERKERLLWPTELGQTVNTVLVNNLPDIFNVDFTVQMENQLDNVEAGERKWDAVVEDFYIPFNETLTGMKARKTEIRQSVQEKTGEICDKCGGEMVIKWGRNGKFIACSNFPECKNAKPLNGEEPEKSNKTCPKCGGELLVKNGRYGKFLGCANYPKCKHIENIDLGIRCPKNCGGKVTEKRSKRGKVFYGCNKYPECDFVSWYQPVIERCPECANAYMELRHRKEADALVCPKCKFEKPIESSKV